MGIKKFFKIKPPEEDTVEANRDQLNELGVTVKNPNKSKREKFAAYGRFAKDKASDKVYAPPGYAPCDHQNGETLDDLNTSPYDEEPSNPYMSAPPKSDFDPYARNNSGNRETSPYSANPYERNSNNPYGANSPPYGQQPNVYDAQRTSAPAAAVGQSRSSMEPGARANPYASRPSKIPQGAGSYGSNTSNPYSSLKSDAYTAGSPSNPYAAPANNLGRTVSNGPVTEDKFDFEGPSSQQLQKQQTRPIDDDDIDLNATLQEEGDDLNGSIHDGYAPGGTSSSMGVEQQQNRTFKTFEDVQKEEQLRQQQQEDEEVDEIKQQIKFTKQGSVASTRNTLKMAQDAEMAGMNTLGMLGHQSETLNNVENNLNLMKMQNRVADDKVQELKKLNRNILAVHVSNPFNSKRRLREAEDKIRMQRVQDKIMQQEANSTLHQSTRRIEGAMNNAGNDGNTVRERYQNQQILDRSKRYQFENDEEDDEMELEIDRNLDKIGQVSSRLKKLAVATGEEINSQQDRIKSIEEDTDNMDIKIHLNTTRLTHIR